MKTFRPKPLRASLGGLSLTPEEGVVLSRIDGRLTVKDLVALTGLESARVEQIVTKLATQGAVALEPADASGPLPATESSRSLESSPSLGGRPPESSRSVTAATHTLPDDEGTASLADFAAALGMDPSAFAAAEAPPVVEAPVAAERVESRSNYPPPAVAEESQPQIAAAANAAPELEEIVEPEPTPAPEEAASAEEVPDDDSEEVKANERHSRQIYETRWHPQPTDARVDGAHKAQGPDLLALCFDPDPRVIAAVLQNHTSGLEHVRLIAFHHRTTTGLEMISRRTEFLRDLLVERRLLRNPQCGDIVLGRIMSSKRVFPTYKIAIDREVPELTRVKARGFLRQKFQTAPPEERSDLVIRTEGRCLILMTGCTFDARTTQILCGRPYNSVLFIQNLAKFSATPPALLAHLMKQPFVRKNQPLRKLLLQHPNMPGDVKRQF